MRKYPTIFRFFIDFIWKVYNFVPYSSSNSLIFFDKFLYEFHPGVNEYLRIPQAFARSVQARNTTRIICTHSQNIHECAMPLYMRQQLYARISKICKEHSQAHAAFAQVLRLQIITVCPKFELKIAKLSKLTGIESQFPQSKSHHINI